MSDIQPQTTDPRDADPDTPLRMHIALKMLRAWGMGDGFDASVVLIVRRWLDGGKRGAVPWPSGPFFEEWAEREGLANVDGYVGFRITGELT